MKRSKTPRTRRFCLTQTQSSFLADMMDTHGVTQKELAWQFRVAQPQIARLLKGKRPLYAQELGLLLQVFRHEKEHEIVAMFADPFPSFES